MLHYFAIFKIKGLHIKRPLLVSIGLFGIASREAAIKLLWISIVLSVLILLTSSQRRRLGRLGGISISWAVITGCSIYWNDRNNGLKAEFIRDGTCSVKSI